MNHEEDYVELVPNEGGGNGMSVAALVLGILGVVMNLIPIIPYIMGILAVVLGVNGRSKERSKGMALAGIILGIATISFKLLFWLFFIFLGFVGSY